MPMDVERYIANCRNEIYKIYQLTKDGKPDDVLKHRIEGFIQAGIFLDLITPQDAKLMMENIHLEIFGESVEERKKRKASFEQLKVNDPDKYFDEPAINRKR
ncbi:hypothetical protein [Paraglaciecola sp.]|uniref:hypothetical protein n=1 Tax=Paraglaciecola sp. TaxID=1920173 RepID=UPI0030F3F1B2